MKEEDSHRTLDAIDSGGHVGVGLFDQHCGRTVFRESIACKTVEDSESNQGRPLKIFTEVMR